MPIFSMVSLTQMGLTTLIRIARGISRAAALETAHTIAAKSPHAVRAAKRLLRAAGSVDEAEGFRMERHEIAQLIGSHNQVEAVQAFFEQRDPVYSAPD